MISGLLREVKEASVTLPLLPPERIEEILLKVADKIEEQTETILAANAVDL